MKETINVYLPLVSTYIYMYPTHTHTYMISLFRSLLFIIIISISIIINCVLMTENFSANCGQHVHSRMSINMRPLALGT